MRLLDSNRLEERSVAMMSERALLETQQAFDGVASDYDRSNAENTTLCEMRRRVLAAIGHRVAPGAHILDLGCGPGCDAVSLAQAGYRVTAIDWSPAMVDQATRRVSRAEQQYRVEVRHLGIQELDRLPSFAFDAAYSNFGPLNCVPDLADAARQIARRLRHGGLLVTSVIGRVCPWEIALFTWRGDFARARARFADGPVPVPLNGRTVWTQYYSPREFERTFVSAGFRRVLLRTLGLLAPPPYMQAFVGRHPELVARLLSADDIVGEWPGFRSCGDHFLIVLERT
jgi:ubiquinone/menaquinone biosynthesis C-methylase UbiE